MPLEIIMPRLCSDMGKGSVLRWFVQPGDLVESGETIAEVGLADAVFSLKSEARGRVVRLSLDEGAAAAAGVVLAVLEPEETSPARPEGSFCVLPPGGKKKSVKIRRLMERKMTESWQTIPHFFVTVAVDMTDVIRFRKDLNVTINDFILAAVARSLREHPWINSHWVDGEAVEQPDIHLSVAVATDRGLFYPVLRDCGHLSIQDIHRRARSLAEKAQHGSLAPEEMEGGTFTVSNMGMLGVESFGAIITPPQAAVLAVGTIKGEVVVDASGEPGIATMLRLTLSADHRVLDGADAAEFLATLKTYLEAPVTLVTCDYRKSGR